MQTYMRTSHARSSSTVAALLTADVVTSTHEQRPACPGCSIEAERKIQICIVKWSWWLQICKCATYMQKICKKYAQNMLEYVEICIIYANNMQQICTNMQVICILYAYICINMHACIKYETNMQNICNNIQEICKKYAQICKNMHSICKKMHKYARNMYLICKEYA